MTVEAISSIRCIRSRLASERPDTVRKVSEALDHPFDCFDRRVDLDRWVRELRRRRQLLVIAEQGTRVLEDVPRQHCDHAIRRADRALPNESPYARDARRTCRLTPH